MDKLFNTCYKKKNWFIYYNTIKAHKEPSANANLPHMQEEKDKISCHKNGSDGCYQLLTAM